MKKAKYLLKRFTGCAAPQSIEQTKIIEQDGFIRWLFAFLCTPAALKGHKHIEVNAVFHKRVCLVYLCCQELVYLHKTYTDTFTLSNDTGKSYV